MSIEPGVVDANVLVYATNVSAPQYAASRKLLDAAKDSAVTLFVTAQIVCELYSVITNPRRVASPVSSANALHFISALLALPGVQVLPTPAQTVSLLLDLILRYPITGSEIFDLQIVATMKANGILRIYSFNAEDFEKYPDLVVIVPG